MAQDNGYVFQKRRPVNLKKKKKGPNFTMENFKIKLITCFDNSKLIDSNIVTVKFELDNGKHISIAVSDPQSRMLGDEVEITANLAATGLVGDNMGSAPEQRTPVEPIVSLNNIIGIDDILLTVPNSVKEIPVNVTSMAIKIPDLFDGDNNIISIPQHVCSAARVRKISV